MRIASRGVVATRCESRPATVGATLDECGKTLLAQGRYNYTGCNDLTPVASFLGRRWGIPLVRDRYVNNRLAIVKIVAT